MAAAASSLPAGDDVIRETPSDWSSIKLELSRELMAVRQIEHLPVAQISRPTILLSMNFAARRILTPIMGE